MCLVFQRLNIKFKAVFLNLIVKLNELFAVVNRFDIVNQRNRLGYLIGFIRFSGRRKGWR